MPRRLKLSPLQRDILVILEEAGAETVGTVIATLNPSKDWELFMFPTSVPDTNLRIAKISKPITRDGLLRHGSGF